MAKALFKGTSNLYRFNASREAVERYVRKDGDWQLRERLWDGTTPTRTVARLNLDELLTDLPVMAE